MKRTRATKADAPARGPYFSTVLEKGLRILGLFTPETPTFTLKEITRETRINSTSAFRFVETLVALGYLKKDPKSKVIKLGPMALAFSNNVIRSFDMVQIVKPLVDEAFERLKVSIDAAIVEEERLVILYRREAENALTFRLPLMSSHTHCAALGKAYLSALPEDVLSRVLDGLKLTRRTPHSLVSRSAILADLRKARERGWALNNEEYVLGLISVAAPLVNSEGTVLGAVSIDVSTAQYSVEEAQERFVAPLLALTKEIRPMLPI